MRDTVMAVIVLLGQEDGDWEFIETDPNWWALHLLIRRMDN